MPRVVENQPSALLSNEENGQVFRLVGPRCQTLCTTVVQLYCTQAPQHSHWVKQQTGILCFVKDNVQKNFFFRLFCLKQNTALWEHEMYNNMEYFEGTPFFHMFEAEDCIVAFNFASVEEARDLRIIVNQKVNARKRHEKKARQSQTLPYPSSHIDPSYYKKTLDPAAKLNKKKRNLTKADIGIPSNFKHLSHVGWSSASGFDVDTEDEQLKVLFQKAGVSEQQLQDQSTREYIYDFINKNGLRDIMAQHNNKPAENSAPPAVPPRGPARAPHLRNAPPPPIPTKQPPSTPVQKANSNVSRRSVPPKKPPPAPVPPLGAAPPVPGSAPAAPPPPPPPPPMAPPQSNGSGPPPPPPPPMMNAKTPSTDGHISSTLLQEIRNGAALKPVEEKKVTPVDDSRGDLLSEIRQGWKLKPVVARDVKPTVTSPSSNTGDVWAGLLARALAERSKAIHSEDEDDNSNESDEDEEWED